MSRNLSGISSVGHDYKLVTVIPTLDTSAYAIGDVMAVTAALAEACIGSGHSTLESVRVIDNDDKKGEFDILILNANTSIGTTLNDPYAGADTVTDDIIDIVKITEDDYVDMIGARVAFLSAAQGDSGMGVVLQPADKGSSLYYALIAREAETWTAAGLEITFAFKRS